MFARFDENPAMTLRVIKETKRYGRTDGRTDGRTHGRTDARTDGRTHGQRENSIPPTNKVCGGYNDTWEMSMSEEAKQNAWAEHYERLLNVEFDWDPDHLSNESPLEGPPIPITIDMVK